MSASSTYIQSTTFLIFSSSSPPNRGFGSSSPSPNKQKVNKLNIPTQSQNRYSTSKSSNTTPTRTFRGRMQYVQKAPQLLLLCGGGGCHPLGCAATAPNPIHNSFFFQTLSCQLHKTSREYHKPYATATTCDISPDLEGVSVTSTTMEDGAIKMKINVSGIKSEAIFDSVFSKMVSAAQPIPGFRRVKGGKTPNIRRDVLIQILGPSKVYKQVIKKIINSTVAEYVEKQKLKVRKDLRVEQSFEELESRFVAGEEFSFDAIVDQLGGEE